jgi:hypothetical protein
LIFQISQGLPFTFGKGFSSFILIGRNFGKMGLDLLDRYFFGMLGTTVTAAGGNQQSAI